MQHFPNFSTANNNSTHNQGMFYHHSNMNNNNYNKSSSYPNFASSNTGGILTNNVLNTALHYNGTGPPPLCPPTKNQELQARDLQAVVHAFNESYRHSLSNLISMQQPLIMQQAIQAVAEAASVNNDTTQTNEKIVTSSVTNGSNGVGGGHDKNTSSIGDINSRLEFLCLQMTEQAIN